jgi:hypothetical protein
VVLLLVMARSSLSQCRLRDGCRGGHRACCLCCSNSVCAAAGLAAVWDHVFLFKDLSSIFRMFA